MRPRLRRIYRLVRRALEPVPLGLPGLVLIGVALLASFRVGRLQTDYLLYPAGLAALGLVGIAIVVVSLGALLLYRHVRALPAGVPERLETTQPIRTGFRFPRFRFWPLIEVTMRWEEPGGVVVELLPDGQRFLETVTPKERGRHPGVVRRFTISDVFGLARVTFRVRWSEPVTIAPASAVAGAELAASHAFGEAFAHPTGKAEGDLIEMRKYGPGDPMRHVLWKTYARTRRLLVRMPERAIAPKPATVAFLVAGDDDEPAAAVARLYLERGFFGPDFLFCADGAEHPTNKTHEAIEQIIDSAARKHDGGAMLTTAAAQIDRTKLGSCVVFAPPVDGPWRQRVSELSRLLPSPATVVIGIEGSDDVPHRSRIARILIRPEKDQEIPRSLAELPRLREALEGAGLRVQVLHRQTGRLM
jgi:hypothetical protein